MEHNHRFYYSASQDQVIKECRYWDEEDDGRSTYIKLDSGDLVRYTQWCSRPQDKCNWDDAVLIAEFNLPEREVLKKIVRV